MKLEADEKEILDSVERGEWRSARAQTSLEPIQSLGQGDLQKGSPSQHSDLDQGSGGIQKRALEEGLPYQTLIASLLHKYASGRLREA